MDRPGPLSAGPGGTTTARGGDDPARTRGRTVAKMAHRDRWELAAVGLPPLALAAAGLWHPIYLTNGSAMRWHDLHVVLLPVFPLLALGPWLLARRNRRFGAVLGWLAGLAGYVYAAFYGALDVLAGIGAGTLQEHHLGGTGALFAQADRLAAVGTWSYLLATVVAVVSGLDLAQARARRPAHPVPGARLTAAVAAVLVVAGAWSFRSSHIFPPRGVLTMIALAIGWSALAAVSRAARPGPRSR